MKVGRGKTQARPALSWLWRLPWWSALIIALLFWLGVHILATIEPPAFGDPATALALHQGMQQLATLANLLLPLLGATAALIAWLHQRQRRKRLLQPSKQAPANSAPLSWQEFQRLVDQYTHRLAFTVSQSSQGANGGLDQIWHKDGSSYLARCRHWPNRQLGVAEVSELLSAAQAQACAGAYLLTSGSFSSEALMYSVNRGAELIDGKQLLAGVQNGTPAQL